MTAETETTAAVGEDHGGKTEDGATIAYLSETDDVKDLRVSLYEALAAITDFKNLDQVQELEIQLERLATDLDGRIAAAQQSLVDLRSVQFDVGIRRESTRFLLRSLMEGGFADWEARNLSRLRGEGGPVI